MRDYFWIFILGIITTVAIVVFLMTVTKSTVLIKKLKLPKIKLALNFLLLGIALTNIS